MGRLTGKYSAANPPPKGRKYVILYAGRLELICQDSVEA
jgi:hypothetical protein